MAMFFDRLWKRVGGFAGDASWAGARARVLLENGPAAKRFHKAPPQPQGHGARILSALALETWNR